MLLWCQGVAFAGEASVTYTEACMTTSEGLIRRACDVAVSLGDKGMVAEATVVMTLVSEYRVALINRPINI